ncbi:MAG: 6-carboxytetrahydropterin synthase [Bryobacterales bacterium]|nr:6-carboxytetrahydropterin synthase [Bryobacterales bacterium]
MIRVTRRYPFAASHRLHAPSLTDEDNSRIFGKCNNPFGHGHNYVLEVSVRGPVDRQTGVAIPLGELDGLVKTVVLDAYDHRNLNEEIPAFRDGLVPTTENVAVEISQRLRGAWPEGFPKLEKIRIAETDRNIFEMDERDHEGQ